MVKSSYYLFLLKGFVFLVCAVALDRVIGIVYKELENRAYYVHPMSVELIHEYMVKSSMEDIVIVGSSTASHHYIPLIIEDSLEMSTINCGIDGHFFLTQYCLINMLLDRHSPSIILWEIGESSLSTMGKEKYDYQGIDILYPFYSNVYARSIINQKDTFQRFRMLSMAYRNNSKLLGYLHAWFTDDKGGLVKGYRPLNTTGEHPIALLDDACDFPINEKKIEMLIEIIQKCKKNNTNLIVTSSPRFKNGAVKLSEGYVALEKISMDFGVPIFDFYSLYLNNPELFKDENHLNDFGAQDYMRHFIPKLRWFIASEGIKDW